MAEALGWACLPWRLSPVSGQVKGDSVGGGIVQPTCSEIT